MNWILHSKPWISQDDEEAVKKLLSSGMIGQGAKVSEFEKKFSDWVGGKDGVAVSSGAAAVQLALVTLGIGAKHQVILPTYVCESVLEAVLSTGATPILSDVGENWVIETKQVEKLITKKTGAIIVPHMYGIFADVKSFKNFGIPIIEDCAQAVGDKSIDTIIGDIAVFSFHPTKCLTTGEGGMMVSKNETFIQKAKCIRDGDKSKIDSRILSPMSDIQAALGLSQLKRYPDFLKKRREMAGKYLIDLAVINMKLINYEAKASSMFFRLPVKINGGCEKYQRLFEKEKIHVRKGVDKLLHRLQNLPDSNFPVATKLFNETVSIPIYPALTKEEILRIDRSLIILKN